MVKEKKLLNIRDDDLCFYSEAEEIENLYYNILENYNISIGIVPFSHESHIKAYSIQNAGSFNKHQFPAFKKFQFEDISEDNPKYIFRNKALKSLIKKLINNNRVELCIHGFSHIYSNTGPEMIHNDDDFSNKLNKIINLIGNDMNISINSFIPPSNTISYNNFKQIIKSKKNLFTSSVVNCIHPNEYLKLYLILLVKNKIEDVVKLNPKNIRKILKISSSNYLIRSFTITDLNTFEKDITDIKRFFNKEKYISIATHYHSFREPKYKKKFLNILEWIEENYDIKQGFSNDIGNLIND